MPDQTLTDGQRTVNACFGTVHAPKRLTSVVLGHLSGEVAATALARLAL